MVTTPDRRRVTPTGPATGFAQTMIPHHRQAVEMAGLAGRRASDPEVKKIAQEIGAAQAPEVATMTGWLSA